MGGAGATGRWRPRLGARLFASYLAVLAVAFATLFLTADAVTPRLFADHVARMMGAGGRGRMMGPGAAGPAALDAALEESFRSALLQGLTVAGAAAGVAALGASALVTRRIVGPVTRLAAASRRIAAGRYDERVAEADGELGDLGASFNEMAASLATTERRRSELIGDVAHELRTPVAVLEGTLEALLDGVAEPSQATWARLHDEAARLRRLVDDLQQLSRAEAGQIALAPTAVAPADLARAAVERLAEQFEEKGLTLRLDPADDLPPVLADRDRAVQVLTNLLVNALRYTPAPGSVRVRLEPAGQAVRFSVADSGMGIAAEHLPRVFDRFYRADRSRSRASGGTGVGLTIARALVEAMGGQIEAASAGPGKGATFSFTLPVALAGAASSSQRKP
jgi:signal transduction histidine kinase